MNLHNTTVDVESFGKYLLASLFAGTLVAANLTASKLAVYDFPVIGEVTGSVAAFMIGISFLVTDLSSEIYGKETTRYIVNGAIAAVALSFGLVGAAIAFDPAPAYQSNAAFTEVFSASYPILIGSVLSLIVSQNLDVSVFHAVRERTGKRHKWLRNVVSTSTSQLLDTSLFTVLAFIVLPPLFGQPALGVGIVVGIIGAEYVIKLSVAALDTVVFYAVTGAADRADITHADLNS